MAATAIEAAVILIPRMRSDIRRNSSYFSKQGEQLTTWAAGRSSSVRRRSRYAIARKVKLFGQPTRLGFGKPVLECFLPRATMPLNSVEDMERLDSVIRIHSMQRAFIPSTAVSIVNLGEP